MTIITRQGRKLVYHQLSVLVVDDQAFYRNLLSEVLRSLGVNNITTAVDGVDALDAIENSRPNVVFADWVMPEMDGLQLTRRVRRIRDERMRMVPIIMVTANNLKSQIEEARNMGVDTFILKPVTLKSVTDRLKEVIEHPRDFVSFDTYVGPSRRRNRGNSYFGPFMRHDDPIELEATIAQEKAVKGAMSDITKRIHAFLAIVRQGNLSKMVEIRSAAAEVLVLAQKISDQHLAKVCWSLTAYIDKMVDYRNVRIDIVATHLESMEVLIKTPNSQAALREEIANGLQVMVTRAISAA